MIAVPFLFFALLDPFVRFSDWPAVPGARDGATVQLGEPAPSGSGRTGSGRPDRESRDRDALALLAPPTPDA